MRRRGTQGGFTLVEVLVVMALLALVMGVAVRGIRSVAKSDLRSATGKMAGAIRYLFDRASTTGKMHRLVIDFETGKYWAEVSDDRYYMPRERETEETREEEEEQLAEEQEQQQEKAEALTALGEQGAYDISRYQPEEFRPKRARFSAFKAMALKPVTVGPSKIAALFTPRLAEPMSSGKGHIYFFPLGLTEAAVVHLSDEQGETFYSLVVHPLTGRVMVHNRLIEPPVERQYDDSGKEIVAP